MEPLHLQIWIWVWLYTALIVGALCFQKVCRTIELGCEVRCLSNDDLFLFTTMVATGVFQHVQLLQSTLMLGLQQQ